MSFKSVGAFLVATCWLSSACSPNNKPANGKQLCAAPSSTKRCPDGYQCASDNHCWRTGTSPDGGPASGSGGSGGGIVMGTGGTGAGTGGAAAEDGGLPDGAPADLVPGTGGSTGSGGTMGTGGASGPDGSVGPDGPLTCSTGNKLCGGACVAATDPAYGCGAVSCDASACPAVPTGGTLACQANTCVIGTCGPGTKKCAGRCVSQTDPAYGCGATTCDASTCPVVSGTATLVCQGTTCVIGSCGAGTKKCGDKCVPTDANNGCGDAARCTPCAANETCTGTPTTSCQCVPNNTAACTGKACGPATNNCGQAVTCTNTCVAPNTCNGGTAGVNGCGCTANNTAACTGKACGPATNNCGQAVTCTNTCTGAMPVCSGNTCVQCGADSNCSAPNPRCFNNACVQCTVAGDCTSYGAGASCNTTTHACQCRRPSSTNLLMNPGFDSSLANWVSGNSGCTACPPLEVWDNGNDGDACPASGAVRLGYYGFAFGALTQCVRTGPATFRFGYRFKQSSLDNGDAVLCTVAAYAGNACAGSSLSSMQYYSGTASAVWANPSLSTLFVAPANTGSVLVTCQSSSLADTWVDQVYLNNSTGSF